MQLPPRPAPAVPLEHSEFQGWSGPAIARVLVFIEAAMLAYVGISYVANRQPPALLAACLIGAIVLVWGGLQIRPSDRSRPAARAGQGTERAPWDWTDFVIFWPGAFTAATILVSLSVPLADSLTTGADQAVRTAAESSLAQVAFYAGALINIAILAGLRRGARLADLGWRRFRWWWIPLSIGIAWGTLIAADELQVASQWLLPKAQNTQCVAVQHEYGHVVVVAVIVVCIIAPLSEETIFRGFIYGWLHRRLPVVAAVAISAAIFAALHGVLLLFIPLFFVGCVLATVFQTSRSLWPGAIVHALFNLPGILAILSTPSC